MFAPQFFQHSAKAGEVTIGTTYGLVDVRICLDGGQVIIGVPFKELNGDTLKAKFGTALATSSEAFLNLAKVKGFVNRVITGSGLLIPNGYMMAAFFSIDAFAVKFCCYLTIAWSIFEVFGQYR